jgi:hypothetical protein
MAPGGGLGVGGAAGRSAPHAPFRGTAASAREDVERAMTLLRPAIEATIADPAVSHDGALVIVVMDPAVPPHTPFDEAILARHAFGRAGTVDVDYERYALDKAQASFRERCDTSILRERGSALLSHELPLVGGLSRRGWTLGVSGAVPAFDEAIGGVVIELLHALQSLHAAVDPPTLDE